MFCNMSSATCYCAVSTSRSFPLYIGMYSVDLLVCFPIFNKLSCTMSNNMSYMMSSRCYATGTFHRQNIFFPCLLICATKICWFSIFFIQRIFLEDLFKDELLYILWSYLTFQSYVFYNKNVCCESFELKNCLSLNLLYYD